MNPNLENRRVVLADRPKGVPVADHFRVEEAAVPDLGDGQFPVKCDYWSVDPAMRGWTKRQMLRCAFRNDLCYYFNAYSELQRVNAMQPVKQDALDTIDKLPDDADMNEIMYRLYVLDKVGKGQAAVAQGQTTRSDGLRREIDKW